MDVLINLIALGVIGLVLFTATKYLKVVLGKVLERHISHFFFIASVIQLVVMFVILYACAIYLGFQYENIIAIATAGATIASFFVSDAIENIISGINILSDGIFKQGDYIKVDEHEGVVERITLSKTYLRTIENERVSIENKIMARSIIVNRSANRVYRTFIKVPIRKQNYNRTKLVTILDRIMVENDTIVPEELMFSIELYDAGSTAEIWKIEFNVPSIDDIDKFKSDLLLQVLDSIDAEL